MKHGMNEKAKYLKKQKEKEGYYGILASEFLDEVAKAAEKKGITIQQEVYERFRPGGELWNRSSETFNLKREIEKLPEPIRTYFQGGLFSITYGGPFTQDQRNERYEDLIQSVKRYIAANGKAIKGKTKVKGG